MLETLLLQISSRCPTDDAARLQLYLRVIACSEEELDGVAAAFDKHKGGALKVLIQGIGELHTYRTELRCINSSVMLTWVCHMFMVSATVATV